jgi:hypothetical protein
MDKTTKETEKQLEYSLINNKGTFSHRAAEKGTNYS